MYTFSNARIAFGGMAATTKMAIITSKSLKGLVWSPETIETAIDVLSQEMKLPPEAPGAMVRFRQTLAISFLFKVKINMLRLMNYQMIKNMKFSNKLLVLYMNEYIKGLLDNF